MWLLEIIGSSENSVKLLRVDSEFDTRDLVLLVDEGSNSDKIVSKVIITEEGDFSLENLLF